MLVIERCYRLTRILSAAAADVALVQVTMSVSSCETRFAIATWSDRSRLLPTYFQTLGCGLPESLSSPHQSGTTQPQTMSNSSVTSIILLVSLQHTHPLTESLPFWIIIAGTLVCTNTVQNWINATLNNSNICTPVSCMPKLPQPS